MGGISSRAAAAPIVHLSSRCVGDREAFAITPVVAEHDFGIQSLASIHEVENVENTHLTVPTKKKGGVPIFSTTQKLTFIQHRTHQTLNVSAMLLLYVHSIVRSSPGLRMTAGVSASLVTP